MRVRGLAFIGLVVGAFFSSPSCVSAATVANSLSSSPSSSLDRFFSSDGPESLHEAKNQGTLDEPKAWPQANAWLHAELSEQEREFLALAVTGTVAPNPNFTGGLTAQQLADTTGTIIVQLRFNLASAPAGFAVQLQSDLVTALAASGATLSSISQATFTQVTVGTNREIQASFTISAAGSIPAGTQYQALTAAFASSSSTLRATTSFQNIDLGYFPTAGFVAGATAAPTTAAPSTAAPSTAAPSTAATSTTTAAPSTTTAAPSTAATSTTTAAPSTTTAAPSTVAPSTAAGATTAAAATTTAAPAASTAAPSTAAPSTVAATTRAPTTAVQSFCQSTTCLNGGTCVSGSTSFTCICASGFIGTNCQFDTNAPQARRNRMMNARGQSLTRPKATYVKPKSA